MARSSLPLLAIAIFLACIGVGIGLYLALAPKPGAEDTAAEKAAKEAAEAAAKAAAEAAAKTAAEAAAKAAAEAAAKAAAEATAKEAAEAAAKAAAEAAAKADGKYPAYVLTGPPMAVSFAREMTLVPVLTQNAGAPKQKVWWVYNGAPEHGSVGLVPDPDDGTRWLLVAFSAIAPCTAWAVSGPQAPSASWPQPTPPSPGVWSFAFHSATPVPLPTMRLTIAPSVAPTPQQAPSPCSPSIPCAGVREDACASGMTCYVGGTANAACIAEGTLGGGKALLGPDGLATRSKQPAETATGTVTGTVTGTATEPAQTTPSPAPVSCSGVAGGACPWNMECFAPGLANAACILPAAKPVQPAVVPVVPVVPAVQPAVVPVIEPVQPAVPVVVPVQPVVPVVVPVVPPIQPVVVPVIEPVVVPAIQPVQPPVKPAIQPVVPAPAPAPVSCLGVLGGACAWDMECFAPGLANAACIVPGSTAPTPAPAPLPVVPVLSGLVVHIDPAAYPWAGSVVANLASATAPATLRGTYEQKTVANKLAIHIVNVAGPRQNISCMKLPEVDVRTLSFWFYVTFVTQDMVFLFDGRQDPSPVGNGTYVIPAGPFQLGERVEDAVAYLNGGAAQPVSDVMSPLLALSSSWHHLTIVLKATVRASLKMFARQSYDEGMDVCVGRLLVYNRALTETENRANYDASF